MMVLILMPLGSIASDAPSSSAYQTVEDIQNAFFERYLTMLIFGGGLAVDADIDSEEWFAESSAAYDAATEPYYFSSREPSEEYDGFFERSIRTEDGKFVFKVFTKENSDIVEGAFISCVIEEKDEPIEVRNGSLFLGARYSLIALESWSDPMMEVLKDMAIEMDKEAMENGYGEYMDDMYNFSLTISKTDSIWTQTAVHVDSVLRLP